MSWAAAAAAVAMRARCTRPVDSKSRDDSPANFSTWSDDLSKSSQLNMAARPFNEWACVLRSRIAPRAASTSTAILAASSQTVSTNAGSSPNNSGPCSSTARDSSKTEDATAAAPVDAAITAAWISLSVAKMTFSRAELRMGLPKTSRHPASMSFLGSSSPGAALAVMPTMMAPGLLSIRRAAVSAPLSLPPDFAMWKSMR
mmetsp:Transcript_203/g.696  ORF Transcript_203/g.696 Transcript_203/m.696 type:complete len:201 (-) Transcript_203:3757-4359(-)